MQEVHIWLDLDAEYIVLSYMGERWVVSTKAASQPTDAACTFLAAHKSTPSYLSA